MTDNVNHPQHYKFSNGAEVIDLTENLSFNLGNVVKYVARAGRKTDDPTEDLRKAQFYLNREIERLGAVPLPSVALLEEFLDSGVRQWELLDHVPPNTLVQDKDGDVYRRINGTGKFEIAVRESVFGQLYEWQPAWPFIYRDQHVYGPYTEVKDG
jgi:hypothetical protein